MRTRTSGMVLRYLSLDPLCSFFLDGSRLSRLCLGLPDDGPGEDGGQVGSAAGVGVPRAEGGGAARAHRGGQDRPRQGRKDRGVGGHLS